MRETLFDVVIVANGISSRTGYDKLSYNLGERMLLNKTIDCFNNASINKIIVVSDKFIIEKDNVICVKGGSTRALSVQCGLDKVTSKYVLIHDGARPFASQELISSIMEATLEFDSAVPYLPVFDSVRRIDVDKIIGSVDRNAFALVQTPQGFNTELLKKAYSLAKDINYTDDSEVFGNFINPPHIILGQESNKKITTAQQLFGINAKVGCGFDTHRFCADKKLMLGGIKVPFPMGMEAHSDGDVVIHALSDALLSALGERDIGVLFPDTEVKYKNIDSAIFLEHIKKIIDKKNADIISISIVIMAQTPKLSGYIPLMVNRLSDILSISSSKINISATTTENLGITAESKGIACFALVSLN